MNPRHHIMVIADSDGRWSPLVEQLRARGWSVDLVDSPSEGIEAISEGPNSCIIVADSAEKTRVRDILTGFDVGPPVPVVGIVRESDVSTSVDAMRLGAFTVIEDNDEALDAILAAVALAVPAGGAPIQGDPRDIIIRAENSPLNELLDMIPQIARSGAPVLITGESGTGKELFARTLHNMSPRSAGPFVAVNCGAIPDTLLESELFGYVAGAFTGAHADKDGHFQFADGGTIFLDEIGELPFRLQVKLLRVLQDNIVTPVGATTGKHVDFRVVAATNRLLETEVEEGNFREDLFYRLNVLPLHVPPLRERTDDILVLAHAFMNEQNRINKTRLTGITRETEKALRAYTWPGNIRELQNLLQRVAILKRFGFVELEDLPHQFFDEHPPPPQMGLYVPSEGIDMAETMSKLESSLLRQALEKCDGNKAAAARLLGLNRTTLVEKVKRLRLEEEQVASNAAATE